MDKQLDALCKVIRSDQTEVEVSSGAMTRLAGVSKSLAGTEGIHLAIATIPPACASSPHYHTNCESAIYIVKGKGRFLTGIHLETSMDINEGDFCVLGEGTIDFVPIFEAIQGIEYDGWISTDEESGADLVKAMGSCLQYMKDGLS